MNWTLKFLAAATLAVFLAGPAVPSMAASAGDVIKERRALMKQNGGHMKAIVAYLKKGKGSAADVQARAKKMGASAARMVALFPKGTGVGDGVGKTRAKAEIWQDWSKFKGGADKLGRLSVQLAAAADTGNKKAIAGAMNGFGKQGCGGCHRAFRAPKKKK